MAAMVNAPRRRIDARVEVPRCMLLNAKTLFTTKNTLHVVA